MAKSFIETKYEKQKIFKGEFLDNEIIKNKIEELEYLSSNYKTENESTDFFENELSDEIEKFQEVKTEYSSGKTSLKFMRKTIC